MGQSILCNVAVHPKMANRHETLGLHWCRRRLTNQPHLRANILPPVTIVYACYHRQSDVSLSRLCPRTDSPGAHPYTALKQPTRHRIGRPALWQSNPQVNRCVLPEHLKTQILKTSLQDLLLFSKDGSSFSCVCIVTPRRSGSCIHKVLRTNQTAGRF